MPFAKKFRAMVDFPFAGDVVDGFTVESVDVRDIQGGTRGYIYGVHMVLEGTGGQQGVRKALNKLFASHPVTFSGYGNPYQLWFWKPTLEIESLGDRRYSVKITGAGMRIYLEDALQHFLSHLEDAGVIPLESPQAGETLIEAYLEAYKGDIARKVSRYYSTLRRKQAKTP